MTAGFCLMWIITTLILCPGGTVVYLHVTFSIIPCHGRQGLNTHQGLPAMPLHPAEKHGCLQLYESLEWRCWNPCTGDQHEVIILWAKEAWEALSLAHCGSLKGPASKALRKESLGKFAGRGNKVSCLIRTDPCTFCSRNILETLYKAELLPDLSRCRVEIPHFLKQYYSVVFCDLLNKITKSQEFLHYCLPKILQWFQSHRKKKLFSGFLFLIGSNFSPCTVNLVVKVEQGFKQFCSSLSSFCITCVVQEFHIKMCLTKNFLAAKMI